MFFLHFFVKFLSYLEDDFSQSSQVTEGTAKLGKIIKHATNLAKNEEVPCSTCYLADFGYPKIRLCVPAPSLVNNKINYISYCTKNFKKRAGRGTDFFRKMFQSQKGTFNCATQLDRYTFVISLFFPS